MTELHPTEKAWNDFIDQLKQHQPITPGNRSERYEQALAEMQRERRRCALTLIVAMVVAATCSLLAKYGWAQADLFPPSMQLLLSDLTRIAIYGLAVWGLAYHAVFSGTFVPTAALRERANAEVSPRQATPSEIIVVAELVKQSTQVADIVRGWRAEMGELSERELAALVGCAELFDRLAKHRSDVGDRAEYARQLLDQALGGTAPASN